MRTGVAVTGHTPRAGGGTTVAFGEGETLDVDVVVVSVGPPALHRGRCGRGHRPWWSTPAASSRSTSYCRTAEPGVYAVGDVIATPALAHVGFVEGIRVVKDILGEDPVPVDYDRVPWCIYCHPEVAFAGLSEQAATEAGLDVVTSKHRYIGNGRALILGEPDGLVKIIALRQGPTAPAARSSGSTWSGPWVTEQLGQGYLAVNWEATVDEVADFIQPHPTLERAVRRERAGPDRPLAARLKPSTEEKRHGRHRDAPAGRDRHRGHHHPVVQGGGRPGGRGRGRCSRCRPTRSTPRCRRPVAGYLAEIKVPEGDTVDVGTVLAVVSDAPPAGAAPPATGRRGRARAGRAARRRRPPAAGSRSARAGSAPPPPPPAAGTAPAAGSGPAGSGRRPRRDAARARCCRRWCAG